jgi:adenine-specific DNA-methyltransferase
LAGVEEEKAKRILNFVDSKSNSHSAWLTFMYPRLYIARQLLKDDGVIFISIDDNEVAQLRMLMDEIFGEQNFVAELPTVMNLKGNNDQYAFSGTHEYSLVYSKNKDFSLFFEFPIDVEDELNKWEEDEIGYYKKGAPLKATGGEDKREDRVEMFYPFLIKNDSVSTISQNEFSKIYSRDLKKFNDEYIRVLKNKYQELGYEFVLPKTDDYWGRWRWGFSKENKKRLKHDVIINRSDNKITLYKKQRPSLGDLPSKKPKTIFYKPEYSSGNGTNRIKNLFTKKIFQNPKPTELIKDFIIIGSKSNDIILDFFAGSGTTGDAVMQLNSEDSGERKYILVQLPEKIDPKKSKAAYNFVKKELRKEEPTIFEITKERLIRSAEKIKNENINNSILEKQKEIKEIQEKLDFVDKEKKIEELQKEIDKLNEQDLGFKIFETTPIWENYVSEIENFDPKIKLFDENSLTEQDLQKLLLTWKTYDGLELTQELEKIYFGGYIGYYKEKRLYLMNKGFNIDHLKNLLEKIDNDRDFNPESVIVFGYYFESKTLREIAENVSSYANKKNTPIDFITRY